MLLETLRAEWLACGAKTRISALPEFAGGVEVKTTLSDMIFLNPTQVAKDVALMLEGGGVARASGVSIQGVAYTTYCRACDRIDVRGVVLYDLLKLAKISFSYDRLP